MGKIIRIAGWVVSAAALVFFTIQVVNTASDASVRVYWPLVAIEGLAVVLGGGVLVLIGRWLERSERNSVSGAVQDTSRQRRFLTWMFWGQALLGVAASGVAAVMMGGFTVDSPTASDGMFDLAALSTFILSIVVFSALPWWIGLRVKQQRSLVPALLYSVMLLFAFPIGTIVGGVQLALLRSLQQKAAA
jgi:hypothetical protein